MRVRHLITISSNVRVEVPASDKTRVQSSEKGNFLSTKGSDEWFDEKGWKSGYLFALCSDNQTINIWILQNYVRVEFSEGNRNNQMFLWNISWYIHVSLHNKSWKQSSVIKLIILKRIDKARIGYWFELWSLSDI